MKKKILVTAGRMVNPLRGATRSMSALLNRLSKDYEVVVITPDEKDFKEKKGDYTLISIKKPLYLKFLKSYIRINLQNIWWNKFLRNFLKENHFDFIMSHADFIPSLENLPIKKIISIKDIGNFMPEVYLTDPKKCKKSFFKYLPLFFKIQYPFLKHFRNKSVKVIKDAEIVFANSKFTSKIVKEYTGRNPLLFYSEVNFEDYENKKNQKGDYILFVNPLWIKGVSLMWGIARNLPQKNFLVVGKTDVMGKKFYDLLEKLSNVKIMGDISDMGGVYSKTFLLVSPSTHHEAMGRTPLEAMARGIPSVVSGKGGLPEVVGNTGDVVKNIFNIDEWIEKIKRYDTKSYHGKKSSLCKRRVLEFKRKYASQYIKLKKEINKK